jgi:beta-lactamase regulating signal transducer with metallopeptidase domain
MSPVHLLDVTAALAGFVLKVTFGFSVCWILNCVIVSPAGKFLAWLGFLTGAGAYWLFLLSNLLFKTPVQAPLKPLALIGSDGAALGAFGAWQVPDGWAFPLAIGIRALGGLYLLALAYFLIRYLRKQIHLRWVLRFASPPAAAIAETFTRVADGFRQRRSRLLILSGITSPATFGWLRPTILLPVDCMQQNPAELEDVLRHELHHIQRWDFAANELAAICRALLFFHPAVWYAMRKMQLERELACDLAVVSASPQRRAKYAECLVRFARLNLTPDTQPWGLDFAASSAHLKTRVRSVLRESKKLSGWLLGLRTSCGAVVFAGFLVVAPSLAIVLSFAQRQTPPALRATVHPVSRTGMKVRARRKSLIRAEQVPSIADARKANHPEDVLLVQPDPNFSIKREPSFSRGGGGAIDSPAPENDASNNPSGSIGPVSPPGRAKIPTPSMTSVVLDTVRAIASMPDRDHDHDNH